jgi:hypothetical protein
MNDYKKGDVVQIKNGEIQFPGIVTNVTPRFLFVGKLKFRRDDGQMVKRQKARVYRLNLCIEMSRSIPYFVSDTVAGDGACIDSTGRANSVVRDTSVRCGQNGPDSQKPLFRALLSQLHPGHEGTLAEMQGLERPPEGTLVPPDLDPDGKGVQEFP